MQSVNLKITGRWKQWLMPLGFCVLLLIGTLAFGGESQDGGGVLRSRVYNLRHITSEQARDLFSRLNIGKSYNTLTPDVLIVTSNIGSDLIRATEIIDMLDRTPPVQIRTLMVASESQPLPPLDEFFMTLGSISVGTMTEAPPKGVDKPAIIDVLGDELIAIATEDIQVEIEAAIIDWKKGHPALASEDSAPDEAIAKQVSEKTLNELSAQIEPKVVVKTEEIVEANELTDTALVMSPPVEPAIAEEPDIAPISPEVQLSVESALEEIAQQVFEDQPAKEEPSAEEATEYSEAPVEPNVLADAEPEEKDEEDFLNEGLLEVLAEAEQESVPVEDEVMAEPIPDKAVVVGAAEEAKPDPTEAGVQKPAAEEAVQDASEEDPMKVLQDLLAQVKADEEQALAAQEEAEAAAQLEQEAAKEAAKIQTAKPVEETTTLQAELALLRQRLADLEAKSIEEIIPVPEVDAEEITIPADIAESKIQTAGPVQTGPQFNSQLSEEELDTVVDLPQEVELESLVDLVGKQFGLNYYYDPVILKNQKVKLSINGGKIKVREMYELLESVLRQKGFVMTRRGQLVTIIKTVDANMVNKLADIVIREPSDPIPPGTLIVKTKFTLKNIDTASAKNMLMKLQLGMTNGYQEVPETNTLIVTDYTYRMDQIQKVLNMIDIPGEEKEYEFRTLKYMKPSEMVPKLQELAKQLEGVSLQINAPAAAPRTRAVTTRDPKTGKTITKNIPITTSTPAAAAAQKPQANAVFIDTDDRTNRILMAGKADQIVLINELIGALDVPQYDLKIVREYIIQNVEAAEVIDVLNELALATVTVSSQNTGSATMARTPATGRTTPTRATTPSTAAKAGAGGDQPYISIRPATNSLLVNATEEQHQAIELVIAHVDVVQKDQRTIRQYEIQYVDTQEIMDTLTDLQIIATQTTSTGSRSTGARSTSLRSTAGRTTPAASAGALAAAPVSLPTVGGGSEKELTADQPQISVLETTNSLLVYATPRQHDAIALVIAHADRTPETTSTPYVVYALENQDPLELADVLNKLIQETVEEVKKTSTPTSKIQTGGGTTPSNLPTLEEQNIRVIPDEMSYSLIVYANKRNQQWISELIRELDEYRPQVLLDCTLVVISEDESFKYDMDIVSKTYSGLTLMPDSPISTISGDFSSSSYGEARSTSGNFTGFFNSDMVQALLETVQTKDYGRVMARPKILVNDNQEGEIITQNTTSIAQQQSIVQPATGTSPSYTTTDVSFAEYSEGVTLRIKPHISKGDMLRLEITLGRSDFTLQQSVLVAGNVYPRPPDILSTDVTTVATVPDGTTIILGGLEGVDQQKKVTKVPILGDIPILGGLFRGIDDTGARSKLYVFVKANVLRPSDQLEGLGDIRRVSKKNRDAFEAMEVKFQEHQDWPGIDPKPMDPVKVLEEDDFKTDDKLEGDFVVQDHWPAG